MTDVESGLLGDVLARPDEGGPWLAYVSHLEAEARWSKLAADRAARIRACAGRSRGSARYYDAGYLFGRFGEETGFRPGDAVPQRWPPVPFRSRRGDPDPWRAFFYCLLLGHDEDAAGWLVAMRCLP